MAARSPVRQRGFDSLRRQPSEKGGTFKVFADLCNWTPPDEVTLSGTVTLAKPFSGCCSTRAVR
jgi:hypothetical protein